MISTILLVFSFVLALIAARWNPPGWSLIALALALYFLSLILGHFPVR